VSPTQPTSPVTVTLSNTNVRETWSLLVGAILCCAAKYKAIRLANALDKAHGRFGMCGSCRRGADESFAVLLIVSIMALPETVPAENFAGVTVHTVFVCGACGAQLKLTSAGKFELAGVVVNRSATFAGDPAVTDTAPESDGAIVKSTFVRENVAKVGAPVTAAVTL
jgi:hypothetical protein